MAAHIPNESMEKAEITSGDSYDNDELSHEGVKYWLRPSESKSTFTPYSNEKPHLDMGAVNSLKETTSDFGDGFKSKIKAPLVGLEQVTTSLDLSASIFNNAQASEKNPIAAISDKPAEEKTKQPLNDNSSTAHLAGEMAASATLLLVTTAITRRLSGIKLVQELAPITSGAILGALEPTLPTDSSTTRLARGAQGALSVAVFTHGPKALKAMSLVKSPNSLTAPFLTGAIIGAASEESNSLIKYGHFADPERTLTAAISFGFTNALFHGTRQSAGKGIASFERYGHTQDSLSLRTSYPFARDASATSEPWHLVLGSGGSKAALTGTGVVLALKQAEVKLGSIGGVSGGAIPAAMAASEMTPKQILKFAYETEIHKLVSRKHLLQEFINAPGQLKPIQTGLYETSGLGKAANKIVPSWPNRFWTMAVDHTNEVVMTKNGITVYGANGEKQILSKQAISVGEAVRATSAIPGVFEAINIEGRYVFDGALGKFGKCPTNVAVQHLGIDKSRIIASLPEGAMSPGEKLLYNTTRLLSGSFQKNEVASEAGIVLRPRVKNFDGLRFNLTSALKEEAILEGYNSTIKSLAKRKIVSGEKLKELRKTGKSFENLKAAVNWD
jgi:predicted patatin/cPLA2 family phospholipase